MKTKLQYVLLLASFSLLSLVNLHGQQWPDSKGTDFWFTFIPNFHNGEDALLNDPLLQKEHQLYVYIGAERPTSGTISWRRDDGSEQTMNFRIDDVRQLFSTSMFYRGIELRGICQNGAALNFTSSDNESNAPQSFHVKSLDDVTVYALNQANLTSDAFLVLPTDAIAEDYVVMAYKSDVRKSTGGSLNEQSTPSQFAVVATEDSTIVDITPSVPTPRNPAKLKQRILLDQGESYLVQADMRVGVDPDLTGSLIRASKPVAVFAGQHRALIPLQYRGTYASRDCIVEQMNPIRTWGKNAYVTPLALSSDELTVGYDLYRVVAAYDSTAVIVDGTQRALLQAGQFFEDSLTSAKEVRTSRPALTAQLKKSSGSNGAFDFTRVGDPFMMLVPPSEQFLKQYRFISIQSYLYRQIAGGPIEVEDSIYKEQWMNVVIPTTATSSVRLDNVQIASTVFQRIGSTPFSWAQIKVTDGVHEIVADTLFGIYVYGYGLANSYGYIGGMSFRPLDVNPPSIKGIYTCKGFEGSVSDSLIADTRVTSVIVIPGSDVNTVFTLPAFFPPQVVVPFTIGLRDLYLDGSVTVEAQDAVEQKTQLQITLPGFTVAPVARLNDPTLLQRSYVVPIGRERCDSFEIENYGLYSHTVNVLKFSGSTSVSAPQAPFTIAPGQRVVVRYCRAGTAEQTVADTLLLGDSCVTRPVLEALIQEKLDKVGPKIQGAANACSTKVDITINDDVGADLGLRSARVLDSVTSNCLISLVDSIQLERIYRIDVIDAYLDAIYGFEALDSADNVTRFIDTIPGFSLSVNGNLAPNSTVDFGTQSVGTITCDTIALRNVGVQSISIPSVYVQENLFFSVPQHQFSIIVSPLTGTSSLIVCFEPTFADTSALLTDTIELRQGCLIRKISVVGRGKGLAYTGLSRCDVPVNATSESIIGSVIAIPLPADNVVTLVMDRPTEAVTVSLIDVSGVTVLERSWRGAATAAILLDVAGVRPGAYGCHVQTEKGLFSTVCIVR
ncbi:MAG: IgGFc-binding protein [Candidatus Kapabacteria bacterium]|nr:IgGFc-binding protein [Candidatus Kapabacteria bacterium]